MTIVVISLTGGQFSLLTSEQIDKVRSAQQKKDELEAKEAEEKRKLKYAAVRAGNYRSAAYEKAVEEIGAKYEEKIGVVREGLLFYLQYSARAEETGGTSAEYADYSLSPTDRVTAVKTYYETKYNTAKARFDAFKADTTAPVYLGEYYAGVYDYFANS